MEDEVITDDMEYEIEQIQEKYGEEENDEDRIYYRRRDETLL